MAATPGAPLWRVEVQCEVPNLAVFKRLLGQIDGLDPSLPPEVESIGGAMRKVTIVVRGWDKNAAEKRAVEMICATSLAVMDGSAAVLLHVESVGA